jgi:GNAT superfamily N-acetyltransferase
LPFGRVRLYVLLRALIFLEPLVRRWIGRVPRLSFLLMVARLEGTPVVVGIGIMGFKRAPDEALVVKTGYLVDSSYRRRGIARALKGRMLQEGRLLGARRAETTILRSNIPSQRLNTALGFRLVSATGLDDCPPDGDYLRGYLDLEPPARPSERVHDSPGG